MWLRIKNWLLDLWFGTKHFEAELLIFDVKNLNGRIYTENNVNILDLNIMAKNGVAYGEIGHTEDFSVSLKNVSHIFNDFYIKSDQLKKSLYGKGRILNTPNGKFLKKIYKDVVFRPRSIGEVDDKGVVFNLQILSFDAIPKSTDSYALHSSRN